MLNKHEREKIFNSVLISLDPFLPEIEILSDNPIGSGNEQLVIESLCSFVALELKCRREEKYKTNV